MYEPVTSEDIRLLCLQPGAFDDCIRCTIVTVNRHDHVGRYEALSYVWESDLPSAIVYVDRIGTPKQDTAISQPVTGSLALALRYLRYATKSRTLWVDALSIDQNNAAERGSQVSIMGSIYSSAKAVIAFLGAPGDKTALALHALDQLGTNSMRRSDTIDLCLEAKYLSVDHSFSPAPEQISAISELLARP